jgi:drug/metabolite transporter (DMT)-like permease
VTKNISTRYCAWAAYLTASGNPEIVLLNRSYLYLILATLAWGGNAVAGKLAVGHISPMMLTFWRWFFAVAIIFAISVPQLVRDWPVARKHLPILVFYGVVGFTNFILFRMRVSWAQIGGFSLTLVGVALTASHGNLASLFELQVNFGDALMIIALVAYAVYTVGLRWKPPIHWRSLMALPALFALIASIPLVGWELSSGGAIWPDAQGWIIAAYTGIFASLLAQTLYVFGVEGIGANRAGLFINLVPVFGTLLSVLILGETLQLFHVVALVLALGGIAIAERGKPGSA